MTQITKMAVKWNAMQLCLTLLHIVPYAHSQQIATISGAVAISTGSGASLNLATTTCAPADRLVQVKNGSLVFQIPGVSLTLSSPATCAQQLNSSLQIVAQADLDSAIRDVKASQASMALSLSAAMATIQLQNQSIEMLKAMNVLLNQTVQQLLSNQAASISALQGQTSAASSSLLAVSSIEASAAAALMVEQSRAVRTETSIQQAVLSSVLQITSLSSGIASEQSRALSQESSILQSSILTAASIAMVTTSGEQSRAMRAEASISITGASQLAQLQQVQQLQSNQAASISGLQGQTSAASSSLLAVSSIGASTAVALMVEQSRAVRTETSIQQATVLQVTQLSAALTGEQSRAILQEASIAQSASLIAVTEQSRAMRIEASLSQSGALQFSQLQAQISAGVTSSLLFNSSLQSEIARAGRVEASLAAASSSQSALSTSCKAILAKMGTAQSGTYFIAVGGQTFPVMCDMVTDGGGWTILMVASAGNAVPDTSQTVLDPNAAASYRYMAPTQMAALLAAGGRVRAWSMIDAGLYLECSASLPGTSYTTWEAMGTPCVQRVSLKAGGYATVTLPGNGGNGFQYRSSYNAINPANAISGNSIFTKEHTNQYSYGWSVPGWTTAGESNPTYQYYYGTWTTAYAHRMIYAIR